MATKVCSNHTHIFKHVTDTILVVVAAKTTSNAYATVPFPPDPNSSQSTINTVEREIKESGGEAFALPVDVRDVKQVEPGSRGSSPDRPSRCPGLQLRGYLVVFRREYAHETVPTHAESESRGSVCERAGSIAIL